MVEFIFYGYLFSIVAVFVGLLYHERSTYGTVPTKHVVLMGVIALIPILNLVIAGSAIKTHVSKRKGVK